MDMETSRILPHGRAYLDAVEFDDGPVLAVADHGRLHHLPERRLLGRRHQHAPQQIRAHRGAAHRRLAGRLGAVVAQVEHGYARTE